jgi:hypothetical protein
LQSIRVLASGAGFSRSVLILDSKLGCLQVRLGSLRMHCFPGKWADF